MKRLMFLSIAILTTSTVMCMDKPELTSFEVCGVSYDKDVDTGSWTQTAPDIVSDQSVMDRIDNTISSYESQTDIVSTSTTTENK